MPRVYFATNRNYLSANSPWFGKDLSQRGDLRFGYSDVDQTNKYKVTNVEIYPDSEQKGSFAVFAELQKIMKNDNRDTLIFIHGYNNGFTEALSAAAMLVDCIKTASSGAYEPNVIAYSWPSDGKLLNYVKDRQDAQASALGLARAFLKYFTFMKQQKESGAKMCNQQLHLLCHSMGNYVFRNALQSLLSIDSQPATIFNEVLLMAADEDNDAFDFNYKLLPLSNLARRVSVYFNKEDKALAASQDIKHNMTRLGASGPLHTNNLPPMIKPVDVTPVVKGLMEHGYFNDPACGKVHADMEQTLRGVPSEQITNRDYVSQADKYVIKF
jgi:esterase/lipase superfamily enzyme